MKRKKRLTGRNSQRARRVLLSYLKIGLIVLLALLVLLFGARLLKPEWFGTGKYTEKTGENIDASKPDIDVELLTVNPYSRPGLEAEKITGIVVHYTANPGSTARENRDYFEGLKDSQETKVSSNFVIGLEGEIVQCVPTWEVAYASNERNINTVSIECCHPDETGKFNDETYRSMVRLCAWLCGKFGISENEIIRHYDVTEKICPKYFVEHEDSWADFKKDVKQAIKNNG